MSFKQCMSYDTIGERIEKLGETREKFARHDSGLDAWLAHMVSQQEAYTHAADSIRDSTGPGHVAGPAGQSAPQRGAQPTQQPYYQQYLNASSSNLQGAAPAVRPPVNVGSSQFGSSDFKHSGTQVGAKGKELLAAAGKAGKGLLSKGKSKLRGTGDKVFF